MGKRREEGENHLEEERRRGGFGGVYQWHAEGLTTTS